MIDDTPYIMVDNRKIPLLHRVTTPGSVSADRPKRKDQPFGVVDRVTISSEAIEKHRQLRTALEAEPPAFDHPHSKSRASGIPLLTDSPKKHR